jgi:hypothetical protein
MFAVTCLMLAAVATAPAGGPVAIAEGASVTAGAGAKIELSLAIEIGPGFHVQANPASRPELIPLSVRVTDSASLVIGAPVYPAGKLRRIDASPEPISLYEGSVRVAIPVAVPADARPGERTVRGTMRFQACDDKRCHVPATLPFTVAVRVNAPPARAHVPAHETRRGGSNGARR